MVRSLTLLLLSGLALGLPVSAAPAGTIAGRVVVDGRPAVGATVSAIPVEEPLARARREARGEAEPEALATTAAGPDGAFSLTVPTGPGRPAPFRLRLAAKGAVPVDHFDVWEATESDDLGEIPLRKAAPLAGRVQGPGGRPVAGAQVALLAQGTLRGAAVLFPPARQATTTGTDGTFRFETAAIEGNDLVVRAAGLAPVRVRGARSGALPRTVALAPGASRSGQVKTRGGQPAAGVLVRFEWDGLETPWVETGADGSFRLAGLPPRRGTVIADAGDAGFASVSVVPGDAAAPLVVTLAPPTVLEGRTLDAATLAPVPRVKVVVASESETRVHRSGVDGRYAFVNLRPGGVVVRADEPRYVSWSRSGVPVARGETQRLDVPLTRGASLAGRVVDEDGRPVAGASVNLGAAGENPFFLVLRRMMGDPGAKIVSRADGTFSASRLESGGNRRLTVYHSDFEKGVLGGISLVPGGTRSGAVVTLRRGVVVTGTVTDGDGNPVAGAELTVSESRAVRSSSDRRRIQASLGGFSEIAPARSGPDGRFEMKGIPPGDIALTVKAPGRATEVVDPIRLSRDARPDPVDLVLAPGAVLSGFVKRRTGEGAEGFLVVAHEPGKPPAGFDPDTNPTGPDGAFALDGLKAGMAYDLQLVSFAGVEPGPTKRGVVAPATDLEWLVSGLGTIEGTVRDARRGEPLTEFEVSCEQDGADLSMMGMRRGMGRRTPGGVGEPVAVEAADGRFVLEEVPAGKWQVVVMARGYLVGRAAGVVVEEGTTTEGVEVRLPRGSLLEGRVVDARTRRGVPEARVEISGEAGEAALHGLGREGLFTDADGTFASEGLAPGRTLVNVSHADYTAKRERVLIAEDGGRVEVALSRGGALGGVVLSESRQPVAGAEVSLGGANAPGGWAGNETASDESGRFRFGLLSPGRYTIQAAVEGRASEPAEAVLVGDEEKGDVTLVLVGGATIRGAVAGLLDGPRAGIRVNAHGPKGYWATARTGPDGRFELAGAPAGEISLRATAGDLGAGTIRTATGRVSIAEGQRDAEAELRFEGDGALSGRVTRGGKPAASVRVSLRERQGTLSGSGRTDESGTYRVEGIAAGDYAVEIEGPEGRRGAKRSVRIDGEAKLDVELPTASLAGVVVDAATKQPVSDVRVAASGGASGGSGFATSDTNGRFFVADVEPGAYTLTLRRAGYREARAETEASEVGGVAGTIELTRGDGLELVVRDGIYQIPIRSVSVRVSDPSGATILSTGLLLDGEGKGELTSLRPGRHSLTISSSGYATRVLDGIVVPGAPLPVALTPGGSVEVRSGEASRAKGAATLRDAAGRPHPLWSWGRPGELTLSPAGTQILPNLAPGSYTLEVEAVATKGFSVTEGGVTVVELP